MTETELSNASKTRAQLFSYLHSLGFKFIAEDISPSDSSSRSADLVVFEDKNKTQPVVVVEIKSNLPPELPTLHPAIQQAQALALSFGSTPYILLTDGNRFLWFERLPPGHAFKPLQTPPQQGIASDTTTVIPDDTTLERILWEMSNNLRGSLPTEKHLPILQMLLLAKMQDERNILAGKPSSLPTSNTPRNNTVHQLNNLVLQAGVPITALPQFPHFPESVLLEALRQLEPFSVLNMPTVQRGRWMWTAFAGAMGDRRTSEFFTHPHIADFLVNAIEPEQGNNVIDPACGSGLFLLRVADRLAEIGAASYQVPFPDLQEHIGSQLWGVDRSQIAISIAAMNFALNGLSPDHILHANSLDKDSLRGLGVDFGSFDIVLADPPFGVSFRVEDESIQAQYKVPTARGELLFLQLIVDLLSNGGRAALLVNPGVLFQGGITQEVRDQLLQTVDPIAIISLPSGVFSRTSIPGAILVLEKAIAQNLERPVLMAEVQNLGYDQRGLRTPVDDFPELLSILSEHKAGNPVHSQTGDQQLSYWQVPKHALIGESWSPTKHNPVQLQFLTQLEQSPFPISRLDELVEAIPPHIVSKKEYAESGNIKLLKAGAVSPFSIDFEKELLRTLSLRSTPDNSSQLLRPGDIVLVSVGPAIGTAAVVPEDVPPAILDPNITHLRVREGAQKILPEFLVEWFNSDFFKIVLLHHIAGAVLPRISRRELLMLNVPCPPLEVQERLVQDAKKLRANAKRQLEIARQLQLDAAHFIQSKILGGSDG
jgi:type I restriction enzyme M protein